MDTERVARAWTLLGTVGARRTLARGLVVDVLAGEAGHLSAADIHSRVAARCPEVNLSTVYRTVTFLTGCGVAHVLQWPGEALYGLNDAPHVHAVCERCGEHSELPADRFGAAIAEAGRGSGFRLEAAGMAVFGVCAGCAAVN